MSESKEKNRSTIYRPFFPFFAIGQIGCLVVVFGHMASVKNPSPPVSDIYVFIVLSILAGICSALWFRSSRLLGKIITGMMTAWFFASLLLVLFSFSDVIFEG